MPYGYLAGRETFEDPRTAKAVAKRDNRKPNPATDEAYAALLAIETERTLRSSPNWRAGRPLDESERWQFGRYTNGGNASRATLDAREARR